MKKYTDEVIDFILKNYSGKDNIELSVIINEKFNLDVNSDSVGNFKSRYFKKTGINLRTGINKGCFSKGQVPFNKGKKWDEFMSKEGQENSKKTTFKKGSIPPNRRELFEERIDKNGYIEIKINDGQLNKNWISKHRYIYEQHYGKVPKSHKVIFADGNNRNFDINNLIMVTNAEHLIMNENKLRYNHKELTEAGHLVAKIINKRGKIKNGRL